MLQLMNSWPSLVPIIRLVLARGNTTTWKTNTSINFPLLMAMTLNFKILRKQLQQLDLAMEAESFLTRHLTFLVLAIIRLPLESAMRALSISWDWSYKTTFLLREQRKCQAQIITTQTSKSIRKSRVYSVLAGQKEFQWQIKNQSRDQDPTRHQATRWLQTALQGMALDQVPRGQNTWTRHMSQDPGIIALRALSQMSLTI